MKVTAVLATLTAYVGITSAAIYNCKVMGWGVYRCTVTIGEVPVNIDTATPSVTSSKCSGDGLYCFNVLADGITPGDRVHVSVSNTGTNPSTFCSFDMYWAVQSVPGLPSVTVADKNAC
ncbi:hypothetical protein BGZ83_003594 [Gryganskiella cystojenkinii]|nr:hypothetical protein BGZ83_003594 [Gryganskiella cystojenkinii]